MPYNSNENELEILKYWDEKKIFEKSISERDEKNPYAFYDGPPFATGLPHYGHIVASLMKDVVPRYWTMKGKRVERKWGWDCHGLPIENIIEKKLNLNSKKAIEEYGVDKFNEACRATVMKYAEDWKKIIHRTGRWVDMENDYKTMDLSFMETVWWVFKELWNKGLIYEGKKAMHICPHCVTPLSNFEVTQGYKDIKDISATAKFKILDSKEKFGFGQDVFILAWTTTPWTLPGNVLLAVGEKIEYSFVKHNDEIYIIAKERLLDIFKDEENDVFEVLKVVKGKDLLGLKYEPLFPYFANTENAFQVVGADFVSTEDGTGIVHIAPAFGEDDYEVGRKYKVGFVQHVNMDGTFTKDVTDFAGLEVKPKEDHSSTDIEIIKWLAHNGKLFSKEKYEHSYPHCWRCDTPLLNYATSSWFVDVTSLKEELLKNNKKTNWVPEHIKDGRFGLWLEGARDWAISRNRFWGSAMPIWRSEDGDTICIGSVEELEKLSGEKITDIHKHIVDKIIIKKDGKEYKRIPEVLDCWFESGSMPYGQMHYPFENKEKFEKIFPAEFIAEGQDQTRGWFYTLHVLATALTGGKNPAIKKDDSSPAFKNVIVNGIVLAEDGQKMSKSKNNFPDPMLVLEKYGADAMRYYLVTSPVMHAEKLNFAEEGVKEMYNKFINTLWNIYSFYEMFSGDFVAKKIKADSDNVLDIWIISKLQSLLKEVNEKMQEYKLAEAARPILDFITELSQWYVRRSRDRFKGDDAKDKEKALQTLHYVLTETTKIIAPFTPFIAEKIFLKLNPNQESVHLEYFPESLEDKINEKVLSDMESVRKIVEFGLALREEAKIKVRQPLNYLKINKNKIDKNYLDIIAEELNVKQVLFLDNTKLVENEIVKEDTDLKVCLNVFVSEELKEEGLVREIVRTINQIRKEKNLTISDQVKIYFKTEDELIRNVFEKYNSEIKKNVLASEITEKQNEGEEKKIAEKNIVLEISKS
ncbi:MAG: isoleucine--tRNA ligase [Patescibacteria group bacterium]